MKRTTWLRSAVRHSTIAAALSVCMASNGGAENLKVEPFDRSAESAGLAAFLEAFKEAADDGDAEAVLAMTAPDVAVFNDPDGGGIETLRRQLTEGWSGAEADAYWDEMEKALELGGGFLPDGRYCAPYVYAYELPGATDSLSNAFVIRERAPLYERPELAAGVLGHFSYAVVPVARWVDRGWIEVLLADGRKGYLSREDFRIRGDYHLCFAEAMDGWRLTVFNVGE
jgi:hypothetical protein